MSDMHATKYRAATTPASASHFLDGASEMNRLLIEKPSVSGDDIVADLLQVTTPRWCLLKASCRPCCLAKLTILHKIDKNSPRQFDFPPPKGDDKPTSLATSIAWPIILQLTAKSGQAL